MGGSAWLVAGSECREIRSSSPRTRTFEGSETLLPSIWSCHRGRSCRDRVPGEQFQEIVSGAEKAPLSRHLRESSHEELPESSGLLDLPEDRLRKRLPLSVSAVPASSAQAERHLLPEWKPAAAADLALGFRVVVQIPAGRDVPLDVVFLDHSQVGLGRTSSF